MEIRVWEERSHGNLPLPSALGGISGSSCNSCVALALAPKRPLIMPVSTKCPQLLAQVMPSSSFVLSPKDGNGFPVANLWDDSSTQVILAAPLTPL